MKKYELTDETKEFYGKTLYRIRALIDFGLVKAGDFGGWIEKEENLSQEGRCWAYDNAYICGNARVFDNVYVSGNANVCGNANVFGNANVYGNANVFGYARVFDNAYVCGDAKVSGNAKVFDNACVCDNARIFDNACVCDNARVCENMQVSYSYAKTDLRKDTAASLRCQCNLLLMNNKVIAYKIVNKNLSSLYDENFIYEVGKIAEVKDAEESNESCAKGLHFSNLTYWDFELREYTDKTYLVAEIDVEDIITIQEGKIRCRKAKILDKVDIE